LGKFMVFFFFLVTAFDGVSAGELAGHFLSR